MPAVVSNSASASFSFTASEASAFECKLDSGTFGACTSPQAYSGLGAGSHTFQVRALDGAGNVDPSPASFTWTVDLTAPDTTLTAMPATVSASANASFSFSASEAGAFECKLDSGTFGACTSPQTYTGLAAGSHTFQVRALDGAGNVDPSPASFTWTIDLTAPDTTLTAMPAVVSNSASASFSFSASEASAFECKLDSGTFGACTSPQTYTGLAAGSHTFQVRALDGAGNVDPSPASFTWTIDLTAPDTTLTTMPAVVSNSASASFSFSASEAGSTFDCQLDGGGFASCTTPQAYTGLAAGSHTFQVRALDGAAHVDPSPASFTWTIDLTAPDTTLTAMPATISASANASFSFSASETGAFECKLDSGTFGACTSPQAYTGLAAGSHTFQVRALDGAGNVDPTPASFAWTIDLTAPDTTLTSTPPAVTNSPNASFGFTATEAGGSFECKLDSGTFGACTSPQAYSGLGAGNHTFQVRATDGAGNVDPSPAIFLWSIDVIAPDTALISTPPALTNSTGASFSFTATESSSTFECKLDAGAFESCNSPQGYAGLPAGPHSFQVRATDGAANVDPSPASFAWTIDLAAPDTTLTSTPPTLTGSANASFSFTATEAGSSFACQLDGGGFSPCANPKAYANLGSGPHTFDVRATDGAGNVDPSPAAFTWTIDPTLPILQFSQATYAVSEGGSAATITVTRSGASTPAVQVHYETGNGSALEGVDYARSEGDLAFAPGQTSKSFSIPVTNNSIADGARTVLLYLSAPQNAQLGPQGTAVLTLQDNDVSGTIKFSATGYTYPDKAGYATITVTRSGGSASGASVKYRTGSAGTAVAGLDYAPISSPQTLVFGPNQTSQTFPIETLGNTFVDAAKTVQVLLSDPAGGATLGLPSTAMLTLTNDDTGGGLRFGASTYAVAENAGPATLTVSRSGGVASSVTVQLVAIDGTAKLGTDYGPPSATSLTFAANETSRTFTVPILANPAAASPRTLTLNLVNPGGGGTLASPASATLTITKVGIRFSQSAYEVDEGPGTLTITILRALQTPATVRYSTQDDSAVAADGDYQAIPSTLLSFAAGQTSKTVTVSIGNNPATKLNRRLQLHLTDPTDEALGVPATATVLIRDRQQPQLELAALSAPPVTLVGKSLAVSNTVRNVSSTSAGSSTLRFVLSANATLGDADDLVLGSRSVGGLGAGAISSATSTLTIPVAITPGSYILFGIADAAETVAEQLEDPSLHVRQVPLTIVANLVKTFPVAGDLLQTGCTSPLRDGRVATEGTFVVSSQAGQTLTGKLALTEPLAAGWKLAGAVTATIDISGTLLGTGSYTITQGAVLQTGTATLTGHSGSPPLPTALAITLTGTPTSGETCLVTVTLVAPASPVTLLTVQHDAGAGDLQSVDGTFTATPHFPVTLTQFRALVDIAVDTDFPAPSAVTLTGPSGSGAPAVELAQLAANAVEYRGAWFPGLASAGAWTIQYKGADFDFTLPDPDGPARLVVPVPTFTLTPAGLAQIAWTYHHPVTGAPLPALPAVLQSLRLQLLDPCGVVLHDAPALAPTTTSRVLSPAVAVARVAEVRFHYTDDRENTATVHYGAATPGACRVVEFSAPAYSTAENVSPAAIAVQRVGDLTGTVHVHVTTSPGTASSTDFEDAETDLTFLPGVTTQVVSVPIRNDAALNPTPRTVLLALSNPDGGATLGPLRTAVLTLNDDEPRLKFSSAAHSATEGTSAATVTVQRTGATTPIVSVHHATSDGTAQAGVDYQTTTGVLTFAAGQTSRTFSVPLVNNLLAQGPRTVTLTLSDPLGALLTTPATASLTIADNDPGGTVAFSTAVSSVAAGSLATLTVSRTGGTGGGVIVHYATSDLGGPAGAVAGGDYDGSVGDLIFGPGETTKIVSVQTHPVAGNRALILSLSAPSVGATLGTLRTNTLWIVETP